MALDVYVGSLSRYYAGNWESVGERSARERGAGSSQRSRQRGRPRPARERPRDIERIRSAVLVWRDTLGQSLGERIAGARLDWDERDAAPHFSGRPGWDGFGSLVLWAAYAEHPALRRPDSLPEEWDDDPALVRCNAEGFRSRFSHLVRNIELWLPVAFQFTFEGEDVDGRRIVVGSAATLARQFGELNAATWKAKDDEIAAWGRAPPEPTVSLEGGARHAFAVLGDLAARANQHRLPMKLDF